MAEEKDLSRLLEYRPNLQYEKPRDIDVPESAIGESPDEEFLFASLSRFLTPDEKMGYIPSVAILDSVEITPTDVLGGLFGLLEDLEQLLDERKKDLQNLSKMPSIDDYIKAREESDMDTVYAFEDYHSLDINGDTAAETYPILLDMKEEADGLLDFVNQEFFGGAADRGMMNRLMEMEEANMKSLIQSDKSGDADLDALAEDNHALDYLNAKVGIMRDALQELSDIPKVNVNDAYLDQAENIVEVLADPDMHDHLTEVNEIRFHADAEQSEDAKQRMKRLAGKDQKMTLLRRLRDIQKKKLKNRKLLDKMERANLDASHPMNVFYMDMLDGVTLVNEEAEKLTDDLYGLVTLEEMQLQDLTKSIRKKQSARTLHKLSNDMKQHFAFDAKDIRTQISTFVKHTGLSTGTTLPSQIMENY